MAEITVIIPIYNVEQYVSKCLDSLLNQTFTNFEVWAINDGSPDNSRVIVKEYSKKDKRIRLIDKENGGYGSVLEDGIKNISSKYFLVCDPDDWLEKNALEELYNFAEKNTLDIAVGDKYKVYTYKKDREYITSFPKRLNIEPNKKYTDPKDISRFAFGEVSPHAKLYRTEIAKKINFPHHVNYTDTILYIMALTYSKNVGYINKPLANYLMDRPGNTMTEQIKKRIDHTLIVWNSLFQQLNEVQAKEEYMYFLFILLKVILRLKAQLPPNYSDKDLDSEISKIIKLLREKEIKFLPFDNNSRFNKLVFLGLMNPRWSKMTMKAYLSLKRGIKR